MHKRLEEQSLSLNRGVSDQAAFHLRCHGSHLSVPLVLLFLQVITPLFCTNLQVARNQEVSAAYSDRVR